jgi:hypothetical protein
MHRLSRAIFNTELHSNVALVAAGFSLRCTGETPAPPGKIGRKNIRLAATRYKYRIEMIYDFSIPDFFKVAKGLWREKDTGHTRCRPNPLKSGGGCVQQCPAEYLPKLVPKLRLGA